MSEDNKFTLLGWGDRKDNITPKDITTPPRPIFLRDNSDGKIYKYTYSPPSFLKKLKRKIKNLFTIKVIKKCLKINL